jgi:hypothetical protein
MLTTSHVRRCIVAIESTLPNPSSIEIEVVIKTFNINISLRTDL